MTLLAPDGDRPHVCEPPMVRREVLMPNGPGAGVPLTEADLRKLSEAPRRVGHVVVVPPPVGSTWDCPVCGRVWQVITGRDPRRGRLRGGCSPIPGREWIRAGWLATRRHHSRASAAGQPLTTSTVTALAESEDT